MTCARFRCWREVCAFIPGLGQFCSSHALVGLGTFAMRHVRDVESKVRAASLESLRSAA